MSGRHQTTATAFCGPLVDMWAGRIKDPVVRLRFLKAVAPPPRVRVRGRRRAFIGTVLFSVAFIALASVLLARAVARVEPAPAPTPQIARSAVTPPQPSADVWQVESRGDSETYSNGLRVDNQRVVSNHPRSYLAFPVDRVPQSGAVRRHDPAGIVFHTTESRQAPFEARQNRVLQRLGESVLDYVRRKRAYHFLIDRFGRVHRVVAESDTAHHAGYSVWADEKWLYVNLNESFLGVSFEAGTKPGQTEAAISPAQVRAAAMLTEMLRSRYGIPAGNCVTHAQVSVNPSNMRVGYHTDWASSFPFEQLGLPNNYERALPALSEFGFEYDPAFLRWTGTRMQAGVELAQETLTRRAAEGGLRVTAYKKLLREGYRKRLAETRRFRRGADDEAE